MKPKARKTANLPPLKVRREPPTIEEAVAAAQGLADDVESQVAIAAGLMGIPEDEVRPSVLRSPRPAPAPAMPSRSTGEAPRRPVVVVVERRGVGRMQRPSVREIGRG